MPDLDITEELDEEVVEVFEIGIVDDREVRAIRLADGRHILRIGKVPMALTRETFNNLRDRYAG